MVNDKRLIAIEKHGIVEQIDAVRHTDFIMILEEQFKDRNYYRQINDNSFSFLRYSFNFSGSEVPLFFAE